MGVSNEIELIIVSRTIKFTNNNDEANNCDSKRLLNTTSQPKQSFQHGAIYTRGARLRVGVMKPTLNVGVTLYVQTQLFVRTIAVIVRTTRLFVRTITVIVRTK
jgi:hypothetical protein